MRISPINFNNQNFTSTRKTLYTTRCGETFTRPYFNIHEPSGKSIVSAKILNANSTYFFRSDIPWNHLANYLNQQFPQDKVNIYSFACSDGSEAYSIIIDLISKLGENEASRFFPIIASDVDNEVIEEAKKGEIMASTQDLARISEATKNIGGIERFFEIEKLSEEIKPPCNDEILSYVLHPKEILRKNVRFECKDIEDALDEIKDGNNFILARNFWKYLSAKKCADVSMKLRETLNNTDRFMLGKFDYGISTPYFTRELGFTPDSEYFNNPHINIFKIDTNRKISYLENKASWLEEALFAHKAYIAPFIALREDNL